MAVSMVLYMVFLYGIIHVSRTAFYKVPAKYVYVHLHPTLSRNHFFPSDNNNDFFHVTPSTKSGFISTPCLSGVSRKDERFVENNAVNITLHNVGAGNSVNVRGLWTFQDNQLH